MNFTDLNLNEEIKKAIQSCGYTQPTPVQAQSIPEILAGKDVVVSAQTGTGKTAAFVLPSLEKLSSKPATKKTRILILTPTRELAAQITKSARLYGKYLNFNIVSLVGGMPYHHQIQDLARGADIIVATPGRLMDHIEQKRVDLSHVEILVLDEADRMLDMGFIEDVEYIAKLTPQQRQTLLFSATVDKKLTQVVKHLLKNPVRIDLSEKITTSLIEQQLYKASNQHQKMRILEQILTDATIYKAIIFSATKLNADKLANQLQDDGFAAAALHGDLRQNVRNRTLEQLRRGKIQFLVATDVAARGLDVSDITHVINYDLPKFCEDYVHRIGRTGRAGKTGVAISFVTPADMPNLQRIERFIGQRLKFVTHNPDAPVPGHELHYDRNEKAQDGGPAREREPKRTYEHRSPEKEHNRRFYENRTASKDGEHRDKEGSRERFPSRDREAGKERFGARDRDGGSRDRFSARDRDSSRDRFSPKANDRDKDQDHKGWVSKSKESKSGEGRSWNKGKESASTERKSWGKSKDATSSESKSWRKPKDTDRDGEAKSWSKAKEGKNGETISWGKSKDSKSKVGKSKEGRSWVSKSKEGKSSEGKSFSKSKDSKSGTSKSWGSKSKNASKPRTSKSKDAKSWEDSSADKKKPFGKSSKKLAKRTSFGGSLDKPKKRGPSTGKEKKRYARADDGAI